MPYIICVNQPGHLPEGQQPVAVATIEEAREAAAAEVQVSMDRFGEDLDALKRYGFKDAENAALEVPEHGGLIGPMSDGFAIDIQYYTWMEMLGKTDIVIVGQYPAESEKALIINRYNGESR